MDESLIRHIHRALHHLYDPVELELNPLAGLLGIHRGDVPSALRKALLDDIAALKPGPRVPPDSNAWRVYQVLCYRFEEQSTQEDVAAQMAISPRQVRRLEYTAIRALANHLAAHYGISPQAAPFKPASAPPGSEKPSYLEKPGGLDKPGGLSKPSVEPDPAIEHAQELDFLRKSYPRETTSVNALLDSALRTVDGMLKAAAAQIHLDLPPGLPPVRGQATTLRQVLLNLLLAAIRATDQAEITVSAALEKDTVFPNRAVWITVSSQRDPAQAQPPADVSEFLVLAGRLAALSEGQLDLLPPSPNQALAVRLGLPVAEQVRVLFIDDNEDSLRLFARYLDGTRFLFQAESDPRRALALAEETAAQIIVLDIMLPEVDGWELLGRIRAHPRLGALPVIISTILPHESLAVSLGAAGFLRKPVSREALLTALSQLAPA